MVFRFRALPVAADAEVRDERLCALCCIIKVLFRTRYVHIGVYILYYIYISDLDSSWYPVAMLVKISIIQRDLRPGKSGPDF